MAYKLALIKMIKYLKCLVIRLELISDVHFHCENCYQHRNNYIGIGRVFKRDSGVLTRIDIKIIQLPITDVKACFNIQYYF